jgi:hypothetical protein
LFKEQKRWHGKMTEPKCKDLYIGKYGKIEEE